MKLRSPTTTTDRFKQTLSGRLGVKLKDAVIHWSAQDGQRKRDIPVNRAVARFQIRAGEFLNNDLVMASDRITVRGRGRFNLARDTIDYALTATYGDTVTAPIIGVTKLEQLDDAIDSLDVELTDDDIAELEAPYVPRRQAELGRPSLR